MGLDLVEWVMAVEERFQLRIPDERAAKMKTLGDAVDVLAETWGHNTSGFCASQRVFHQLRGVARVSRLCFRRGLSIHEALRGVELRATEQTLGLELPWPRSPQHGVFREVGSRVLYALSHGATRVPPRTVGEFVTTTVHVNLGRLLRQGARWQRTDAVAAIFEATRAQFGDVELSEATRLLDLSPDG